MTMPHLMNCSHSEDSWCLSCVKELWEEKYQLECKLDIINTKIKEAIETEEPDAGIFLLDTESKFHTQIHDGAQIQVYNNQYFTPLGDKLMEIYKIVSSKSERYGNG